jgi:hypothetical protein
VCVLRGLVVAGLLSLLFWRTDCSCGCVGLWGGCSVGSGEGSLTRGTGDVMFSRVGIARTVFGGFWWGYLVWAPRCSRLGVLGRGIRSREVGVFGRPLSFLLGGGECV